MEIGAGATKASGRAPDALEAIIRRLRASAARPPPPLRCALARTPNNPCYREALEAVCAARPGILSAIRDAPLGRLLAQRAGSFVFAGRGGDELDAARGRFALTLADVIKEPLQVVTSLTRQVVARLADFSQDSIHGSSFQQIKRSANRGTGPARPCAEAR